MREHTAGSSSSRASAPHDETSALLGNALPSRPTRQSPIDSGDDLKLALSAELYFLAGNYAAARQTVSFAITEESGGPACMLTLAAMEFLQGSQQEGERVISLMTPQHLALLKPDAVEMVKLLQQRNELGDGWFAQLQAAYPHGLPHGLLSRWMATVFERAELYDTAAAYLNRASGHDATDRQSRAKIAELHSLGWDSTAAKVKLGSAIEIPDSWTAEEIRVRAAVAYRRRAPKNDGELALALAEIERRAQSSHADARSFISQLEPSAAGHSAVLALCERCGIRFITPLAPQVAHHKSPERRDSQRNTPPTRKPLERRAPEVGEVTHLLHHCRHEECKRKLTTAAAEHPQSSAVNWGLGISSMRDGKFSAAGEFLVKALTAGPIAPPMLETGIYVALIRKNLLVARHLLDEYVRTDKAPPQAGAFENLISLAAPSCEVTLAGVYDLNLLLNGMQTRHGARSVIGIWESLGADRVSDIQVYETMKTIFRGFGDVVRATECSVLAEALKRFRRFRTGAELLKVQDYKEEIALGFVGSLKKHCGREIARQQADRLIGAGVRADTLQAVVG